MTAAAPLVAALAGFSAGDVSAAALQESFESATLFVQRVPGRDGGPAVAALGPPGAGFVPMYSSLAGLADAAGECDWASATGSDLLSLVPEGYGVVIDPGRPHAVLLAADAIRRGVVISRARP